MIETVIDKTIGQEKNVYQTEPNSCCFHDYHHRSAISMRFYVI